MVERLLHRCNKFLHMSIFLYTFALVNIIINISQILMTNIKLSAPILLFKVTFVDKFSQGANKVNILCHAYSGIEVIKRFESAFPKSRYYFSIDCLGHLDDTIVCSDFSHIIMPNAR